MAGVNDIKNTYRGFKAPTWTSVAMYLAAWTIVASLVTLLLVDIFGLSSDPQVPLKLETQLTYLGFVVALAAYLATVAQALKSRINELKDENPQKSTTVAKIEKYQRNLNLVVWAEVLIVWLGCLMTLRMMVGPLSAPEKITWPIGVATVDYFYVVFLGLALLNLVFLHVRQWTHDRAS